MPIWQSFKKKTHKAGDIIDIWPTWSFKSRRENSTFTVAVLQSLTSSAITPPKVRRKFCLFLNKGSRRPFLLKRCLILHLSGTGSFIYIAVIICPRGLFIRRQWWSWKAIRTVPTVTVPSFCVILMYNTWKHTVGISKEDKTNYWLHCQSDQCRH